MTKEIIINSSTIQTRVAITGDGNLLDFFVDYPEKRRMVGDIYLGKVARVLPGIKAAFINIGMKHDGFLHFSDIADRTQQFLEMLGEDTEVVVEENGNFNGNNKHHDTHKNQNNTPMVRLHKGEDIIVQITKEPVKNKGVRVTSAVSLPGRFCVLLPYDNKIGISKKIFDYRERRRLRNLAREIIPENCGLIIRTVARNQDEAALRSDLNHLVKTWNTIEKRIKSESPPALIHNDLNTTSSVIRDLFTPDISKIFIDSKKLYKQIRNYVEITEPDLVDKIEHYRSSHSIFEAFKIEEQIKTLMARKVYLPSGGYLIIEHTEAMVVIDVNSQRKIRKE